MDSFANIWLSNWRWIVPLAVGVVALALAVSPALQMFYGKPQLFVGNGTRDLGNKTALQCWIFNFPIKNKWLKKIGVKRATAEGISCTYTIQESGSGKIIVPEVVPKMITYGGEPAQRVDLPSGTVPVTVCVVDIDNNTGVVTSFHDFGEREIPIPMGRYSVIMRIDFSDISGVFTKDFMVIYEAPYSYWK